MKQSYSGSPLRSGSGIEPYGATMEIQKVAVIALLFLSSYPVRGDVHFWMSVSDLPRGSAVPLSGETPEFERVVGTTGEIYVWARPEDEKTLQNFSLNITSTSDTAIEFDSAVIANDGRFASVFDTTNGLDLEDQALCDPFSSILHGVWGLAGFSIDADSGTGLNAAKPGDDPNYDKTNNSWLLATVGYTAAELGSAELYLEIGPIGLNQRDNTTGEPDTSGNVRVLFGDPDDASLHGADDRCMTSATSEATIDVVETLRGDFNLNGVLDAPDIDLLSAEVLASANGAAYRLDRDSLVNQKDRVFWVETLKKTHFGDATLNGTVEFIDFLQVSTNFGLPGGWAQGDFTGDGHVLFDDFLLVSTHFGLSGSPAAVPEPSGNMLLVVGLFALGFVRRR